MDQPGNEEGVELRPHSPHRAASWWPLAFLFPWLIGFIFLVLFPFAITLYWSFCRYDMLSEPDWVGLENYERLAEEVRSGEGFGLALWNTFYYAAVSVPLSIALGVGLALILSWQVRGQSIYRTLVFVPSIVPVVAAATLWVWLLDPQDGWVNHWLRPLDAQQNWFRSPNEAVPLASVDDALASIARGPEVDTGNAKSEAVAETYRPFGAKDGLVLMSLWGVGNFVLIYLAALRDIPRSLYEAASLDGAHALRRFWHVTLPMLTPVIFFNLVMGVIQSVQTFTQAYIVSEGTGGPAESTLFISIHLFLSAFKDLDMGYTSAMAWVLLVILCGATLMIFRSSRYWVHYQGQVR